MMAPHDNNHKDDFPVHYSLSIELPVRGSPVLVGLISELRQSWTYKGWDEEDNRNNNNNNSNNYKQENTQV